MVETPAEAFEEYIREDFESYITTPRRDAEKVIKTVLDDGAVPVLVHSGRDLEEDEAEDRVEELVDYGLKGIEVVYSWEHKIENDFEVNFAEEK